MNMHKPVMQQEVIDGLNIQPAGVYVDATFGRGGHSKEILKNLSSTGKLLVIDKDPQAIESANKLQQQDERVRVFPGTFSKINDYCEQENLLGKVNGILLDLGVSSPQLDDPQRGFSFLRNGPLDMRMDPLSGVSAAQWLSVADRDEIARVLKVYGEENLAKKIATRICKRRDEQPIKDTKDLANIIEQCYPVNKNKLKKRKHPATKSFQAIRIHLNNEIADLESFLQNVINVLADKGRLVVISFHSLEDRVVKNFINKEVRGDEHPKDMPIRQKDLQPKLAKIINMKKPSTTEVDDNVRARSAVLRVAEKISKVEE